MKREAGLVWPPGGHLLSRGRWRGSNTQRRGVRSDQKGKDNQKNMVSGSQEGIPENDAQCQMCQELMAGKDWIWFSVFSKQRGQRGYYGLLGVCHGLWHKGELRSGV